jgi:hypothetical protein
MSKSVFKIHDPYDDPGNEEFLADALEYQIAEIEAMLNTLPDVLIINEDEKPQ